MNKCNITGFVLAKLAKFKRGIYCGDDSPIYENYASSLDCLDVDIPICHPDNCSNPTIIVSCTITIDGMVRVLDDTKANIFVLSSDIHGAVPPLSYFWMFDETEFDLVEGLYGETLTVILKQGKSFDALNTLISVQITDSLGCKIVKNCVFTPTGMQCASDYVYCANPSSLVIKNKAVYCVAPMGLIVTRK